MEFENHKGKDFYEQLVNKKAGQYDVEMI